MTRIQPRTDGSLAVKLDFGAAAAAPAATPLLRLTPGPDKYRVLEHRRRLAQIAARRLLKQAEEE